MAIISQFADPVRPPAWPWKIGLVVAAPELSRDIARAVSEAGGTRVFTARTEASSFEIASSVERDRPDVLFVELSKVSKPAAEWIADIRRGEDSPLVVAVHLTPDPAEMIAALRAGASEFICLPVIPSIYEAMERIGALLETRRTADSAKGRITGILSAKGGCGATSIACHLGAALSLANPGTRVLVADLDHQAPAAHRLLRVNPRLHAGDAFDAVRHLNSKSWRELAAPVTPGLDLLAAPAGTSANRSPSLLEPWRVESLFRFLSRQYGWVLVDLGRHLNPSNWMFLQNTDEIYLVTAPDVLALYQTRSILQTLSSRGFEKSRIKMILNRNLSAPHDFWVESIQQMFELPVFAVVPNDLASLDRLPGDRFEFPADSNFGRAMTKLAGRVPRPAGPGQDPASQRQAA